MLGYKQKVGLARNYRGLSQPDLARRISELRGEDEEDMKVSTIGSMEARASAGSGSNRADLDLVWAIAAALGLPVVYFVTPDFREYVRSRVLLLEGDEHTAFHAMQPHGRVGWVVKELKALWDGDFSLPDALQQIGVSEADFAGYLEGAFVLSQEQLGALCVSLGVPPELVQDPVSVAAAAVQPVYLRLARVAQDLQISPADLLNQMASLMRSAGPGETKQ